MIRLCRARGETGKQCTLAYSPIQEQLDESTCVVLRRACRLGEAHFCFWKDALIIDTEGMVHVARLKDLTADEHEISISLDLDILRSHDLKPERPNTTKV